MKRVIVARLRYALPLSLVVLAWPPCTQGTRPPRVKARLRRQVLFRRQAIDQLEAERGWLTDAGAASGSLWWCEHRLKRARAMLDSRESGQPLPTVPAEVSAFRIGPLAAVTVPGELFTEIGMRIKAASPFPHTLIAGYTNGSIGYIPTPEAYDEGGYEVTHACRVDPGAGQMIEAEAGRLLRELHRP